VQCKKLFFNARKQPEILQIQLDRNKKKHFSFESVKEQEIAKV